MTSENNTELPEQIGLLIIDDYKNQTAFQNSRTCQSTVGKVTLITGVGGNFIYRSSDEDIAMPTDINFTRPVNDWTYAQGTGFNWATGYNDIDVYSNGTPISSTRPVIRNRLANDQSNSIDGGDGNDFNFSRQATNNNEWRIAA